MKKNLLKIYKKFRDSDILEDCDSGIVLAFLYYIKKGNLEGKSFNENYHANTEKDPLKERLKELEILYKKKKKSKKKYDLSCLDGDCDAFY